MKRRRRTLGIPLGMSVLVAAIGAGPAAAQEPASLVVTVSHAPEPAQVGSDLTYVVDVRNDGAATATDVTVQLSVPAGWVPDQGDPSCSEAGGTLTCSVGSLDPGVAVSLSLVVGSTTSGTVESTATAASPDDPDGAAGTDVATVSGQDCTWVGTHGPDTYPGAGDDNSGNDVVCGLGGDDALDGGPGDDVLNGGRDSDTVGYQTAPAGVTVALGDGQAAGGAGVDALIDVENVAGSPFDDVIRGSAGPNVLSGGAGTDLLYGDDGDDSLLGEDGDDYLDGGPGVDGLDGGAGVNTCAWPEVGALASCHRASPQDRNDAPGLLDVETIRTVFGDASSSWRFTTFASWTTTRMWDEGFFLLYLDTAGGAGAEYRVMVRSNGRRLVAELKRFSTGKKWSLGTHRPNRRSARVTVPMSLLVLDPARTYYRWWAHTLFFKRACTRGVCFDLVPSAAESLIQPRPAPA